MASPVYHFWAWMVYSKHHFLLGCSCPFDYCGEPIVFATEKTSLYTRAGHGTVCSPSHKLPFSQFLFKVPRFAGCDVGGQELLSWWWIIPSVGALHVCVHVCFVCRVSEWSASHFWRCASVRTKVMVPVVSNFETAWLFFIFFVQEFRLWMVFKVLTLQIWF